tara:strand:- start:1705 stop:1986 length:282 start_codon:yes stop_codon:yes gene_type:complete
MKRVIEKKLGWNDIGVLADCYLGIYGYRQICVVAKSYGWDGDMPNIDDIEDMVWASDEAIDWLNNHTCEEGIRVDWHDGALMLMPNEWWEAES